jgi:transposase
MGNQDARRLSADERYQLRKQVIRSFRQGLNRRQISVQTGLSYNAVCNIVQQYRECGVSDLRPKVVGRKSGEKRLLSSAQEEAIQKLISDQRPEQLKLSFALWNRTAVSQLIERECGIKLSIRAVGNYLKRWGFTPQKPVRRFYEQRPVEVKAWLEEKYPAIVTAAKAAGGEIHWGDETAVVNTDVRGRGYSLKGKTPVAYTVGGNREKLSMISTVTNQGKTRWMIIDDAFNADRLIEFLEALVKDSEHKVFLILDNLRVHHCKPVKAWLEGKTAQIEIHYLPSYSPELNPDERLNADLKHVIGAQVPVRTKAKLKAAAHAHMEHLNRNPERVKTYFRDKLVRYAA